MKSYKINVTARDIKDYQKELETEKILCVKCACERAFARVFPEKNIEVGIYTFWIKENEKKILPKKVSSKIIAICANQPVKPFSFTIKL